jgi:hypothetical protein
MDKRFITRFALLIGGFVVVLWSLVFAFLFHHLTTRGLAFAVMGAAAAVFVALMVLFRSARPRILATPGAPLAPSARKVLWGAVQILKVWIVLEFLLLAYVPYSHRHDLLIEILVPEAIGFAFTAFLIMLLRRVTRRLQEVHTGD